MFLPSGRSIGVLCVVTLANLAAASEPTPPRIRAAVEKALPLLHKGAVGHTEHRSCFACHNQGVPLLALTTARSRGLAIDEAESARQVKFIAGFLERNRDAFLKGKGTGGQVDTAGYALWALERGGHKPDSITSAVTTYLLLRDRDKERWHLTANRPPSELSPFTTNYLGLRALQTYGSPEQKEKIEHRISQVRTWLTKTPARDNEDRVFRLWALKRAGAPAEDVDRAARELIRTQLPDGGWAQLDVMKADAYATGSALVALQEAAGLATDDAVYWRGLAYLLRTQEADGSWHIRSRSKPFQTYFESGFPHGKDQFISMAGSAWATTALSLALPVVKSAE